MRRPNYGLRSAGTTGVLKNTGGIAAGAGRGFSHFGGVSFEAAN